MCLQPDAGRDDTQASSRAVAGRPQQKTDPSLISWQVSRPISVAGAARNNPALGLAGEVGDKLEVGVVVQYGE